MFTPAKPPMTMGRNSVQPNSLFISRYITLVCTLHMTEIDKCYFLEFSNSYFNSKRDKAVRCVLWLEIFLHVLLHKMYQQMNFVKDK